jgi:hypothetical protein
VRCSLRAGSGRAGGATALSQIRLACAGADQCCFGYDSADTEGVMSLRVVPSGTRRFATAERARTIHTLRAVETPANKQHWTTLQTT